MDSTVKISIFPFGLLASKICIGGERTHIRPLINEATIECLGNALVQVHRHYPPEDLKKILQYAYEHRIMDGHPHDLAEVLEEFAAKLRSLRQRPDPLEHWRHSNKGQ